MDESLITWRLPTQLERHMSGFAHYTERSGHLSSFKLSSADFFPWRRRVDDTDKRPPWKPIEHTRDETLPTERQSIQINYDSDSNSIVINTQLSFLRDWSSWEASGERRKRRTLVMMNESGGFSPSTAEDETSKRASREKGRESESAQQAEGRREPPWMQTKEGRTGRGKR